MYQAYLCSKKARKRYASRELVDSTGRETADEGKGYLDPTIIRAVIGRPWTILTAIP